MWVFTTIGFFSVVAHRDRRGFVLVRARDEADLNALVLRLPLPRPKVQRTPNADYLFRVVVEKRAMARVLESLTEGIDYDNFKDAVQKAQGVSRAKTYHNVWHALLPLQQPRLAIMNSKPKRKSKLGPNGELCSFELTAEVLAEVKAEVEAELRGAEIVPKMSPEEIERRTTDGAFRFIDDDRLLKPEHDAGAFAKKKSKSTKEDPDAGMIPTAEDLAADARLSARAARAARPEFNASDYATEAEMLAALRARMGDALFERFSCSDGIKVLPDQSKPGKKT